MKYPQQAKELLGLLKTDQAEARAVGAIFFHKDKATHDAQRAELKQRIHQRAERMLQILDEIGEPSISNIGTDAAQAVSILALHDTHQVLKRVLKAFTDLYAQDKNDTYYQAIPSMTDWLLLTERKPQRFGTQWLFDANKQPFLPIVEDFERINERRAEYGIEPLHWPKSLAIPESEQPWLQLPISKLVMREPTAVEYDELRL